MMGGFGMLWKFRIAKILLPRQPSWLSQPNNFSNSESLCRSDASHKVSAQSDVVLKVMLFEEFQDGLCWGHLGYRNGTILAILYLCVTVMPPIVLAQSDLRFGRCHLKAILDIRTERF